MRLDDLAVLVNRHLDDDLARRAGVPGRRRVDGPGEVDRLAVEHAPGDGRPRPRLPLLLGGRGRRARVFGRRRGLRGRLRHDLRRGGPGTGRRGRRRAGSGRRLGRLRRRRRRDGLQRERRRGVVGRGRVRRGAVFFVRPGGADLAPRAFFAFRAGAPAVRAPLRGRVCRGPRGGARGVFGPGGVRPGGGLRCLRRRGRAVARRRRVEALARADAQGGARLHADGDEAEEVVAAVVLRVVAEQVLLREVERDFREDRVEVCDRLRDVDRAARLLGELVHALLGDGVVQVRVFDLPRLHDVDLALGAKRAVRGLLEARVAHGVGAVGDDDEDLAPLERAHVVGGLRDGVEERGRAVGAAEILDGADEAADVARQGLRERRCGRDRVDGGAVDGADDRLEEAHRRLLLELARRREARAVVEEQGDLDGRLGAAEVAYLLQLAVHAQLEVFDLEVHDRVPAAVDHRGRDDDEIRVDAHDLVLADRLGLL